MSVGAPQFGADAAGVDFRDRPTAFGLVVDAEGRLACVRIDRDGRPYIDLPGGALDEGEDEATALRREFLEETGLYVRPVERVAAAAQRFRRTDGEALNNRAGFWRAEVERRDAEAQSEPDHRLVWLSPVEALVRLRHEAHAWAVAAWLRREGAVGAAGGNEG